MLSKIGTGLCAFVECTCRFGDMMILAVRNQKHRTKLLTKEELEMQQHSTSYSEFLRAELSIVSMMINDVMSRMMARQIGSSTNDGQDSVIHS